MVLLPGQEMDRGNSRRRCGDWTLDTPVFAGCMEENTPTVRALIGNGRQHWADRSLASCSVTRFEAPLAVVVTGSALGSLP